MNALANLAVWWSHARTVVGIALLLIVLGTARLLFDRALWSARRRPRYALVLFVLGVVLIAALFLTAPWWWFM